VGSARRGPTVVKEFHVPEYLHPGVYVQEESSGAKPIEGASTSTAAFVGKAARGRPNRATMVTSWAQFDRTFGGLDPGHKDHAMPLAVYQFFRNGGQRAYILRALYKGATPARGTVTVGATSITVTAAGEGEWANDYIVLVVPSRAGSGSYTWLVLPKDADLTKGESSVRAQAVESLDEIDVDEDGARFYLAVINRDSNYIHVAPTPPASAPAPSGGAATSSAPPSKPSWATAIAALSQGSDGDSNAPLDYVPIMAALDRLDDTSILVVPAPSNVGPDIWAADANGWASYVQNRSLGDMFYIMDPPDPTEAGLADEDGQRSTVEDFVTTKITVKTSYAALYFPWVEIADPFSKVSGARRRVPPSGMIAGLYARTDDTRGVWKAPAGTEAGLLGAVGLAAKVSDGDQDTLNPIGVNCIRQFPDAGIVVWGARTLATSVSPEERYVPVRRMTSFLKRSLYHGTQWVVFEPNDEPLWSAIRFNINAFMTVQLRAGAFQGSKAADAFLVKCDADNNIQATIDQGQVHILVAFAPLKPAEFVVIHIQQLRKE
jgi:uncharacterized protein